MIDWGMKIIELKRMVDEMEMWAGKTDGNLRAMLGHNADDLRMFIRQVEAELVPSEHSVLDTPPAWVTDSETAAFDTSENGGYDDGGMEDGFDSPV